MNIIDIAIIFIIAISLIYGAARGFLHSLLSLGSAIASLLLSFIMAPSLVKKLASNTNVVNLIRYYTDNASQFTDSAIAKNSAVVNDSTIANVLDRLQLSSPIDAIVKANIQNKAITSASELSELVSQTIVTVAINILAFIICFFLIFILFTILINILNAVFNFAQLKYGDMLFGAILGIARAVIFLYVIFTIVPIAQAAIPLEGAQLIFNSSEYLNLFSNSTMILKILQI